MSELVSARRGWIEEQRQISLEWARVRVTPRWDWWRHWTRRRESRSWLAEEDGADEEGESKGGFGIALLCSAYSLQPTTWVKWQLTSELELGRCQQPTRCNACLMCWVHSTTFVFYFTSVMQMVSANTMNTKFYCVSFPRMYDLVVLCSIYIARRTSKSCVFIKYVYIFMKCIKKKL